MSFFRHAIPATSTIIKNLIAWWKLGDSQTSAKSSFNNNDITLIGSPTINLNNSLLFNGSSQAGSVNIDLSLYNKITLCFWLNIGSYANTNRVGLEYSANYNSLDGFLVLIDSSPTAEIIPSMHSTNGAGGYQARNYSVMPANETHFYSIILDRTTGTSPGVFLYIDGNLQTPTATPPILNDLGGTNFGNYPLYIMSRAGNSAWGLGELNDLRIYNGYLTQEEIKILYKLRAK